MLRNNRKISQGFTIAEMVVVAPIVILVIGVFIFGIVTMTGDILATRSANALTLNVQDALNRIEQDIKLSGGYLTTNNFTLSSPQGSDDLTTPFTNVGASENKPLILNTYATTSNPLSSSRNILYTYDQPNSCGSDKINQNKPVMLNVVYFVKSNTLWRRVIAPSFYNTVGCDKAWQQPSCTPGYNAAFCKTSDERLVDGINSTGGFVVNYYNSSNVNTNNDLTKASTATVNINATNTVAGRDIAQSSTIRASSPNNNIIPTTQSTTSWLKDGWINDDNPDVDYNPARYRKTSAGIVVLQGLIRNHGSCGTSPNPQLLGILANEFRPSGTLLFTTSINSNADATTYVSARIYINSAGEVSLVSSNGGVASDCRVSLEGIHFVPSSEIAPNGHNYTSVAAGAMSNSWSDYGGQFSTATYVVDNIGRVNLQGLIKNGVTTDGTLIFSLPNTPTNVRPSKYMYIISNVSGVALPLFGINPVAGGVVAKGPLYTSGGSWISLMSMYYPSPTEQTGKWTSIPVSGSNWAYYNNLNLYNPECTKASDGLVSLRGFYAVGTLTSGTIIGTIPANCGSPSHQALWGAVNNSTYSRIEIDINGNIIFKSGINGWLTLDGITYYTDQ